MIWKIERNMVEPFGAAGIPAKNIWRSDARPFFAATPGPQGPFFSPALRKTWLHQDIGLSNTFSGLNFFGVDFSSADNGTLVGEEGIILHTTDGGQTWVTQNSGTSEGLLGVDFTDADTGPWSAARAPFCIPLTAGRLGARRLAE